MVFHYVFVEPRSDDEKDFRYFLWLHASYFDRQKFPSRSEEGKKQLNDEKKIIAVLKEKINNSSIFQQLDNEKQEKLLREIEKGKWKMEASVAKRTMEA